VPVTLTWGPLDPEGDAISKFQLRKSTNGGGFTNVTLSPPTNTIVTVAETPGNTYRFQARATDIAEATGPFATGPTVALSAFQETDAAITYTGSWTTSALASAFGGTVNFAGTAGAKASFAFTGTAVAWVTTYAANRGKAEVFLDGVKVATLDLYSASTKARRIAYARNGLSNSAHTLEIRVLGIKNAASTGQRVDVDAFVTFH